jgi:hypothetical protein
MEMETEMAMPKPQLCRLSVDLGVRVLSSISKQLQLRIPRLSFLVFRVGTNWERDGSFLGLGDVVCL